MAKLREKLSARETKRRREETEAEVRRREQGREAWLKRHDNHHLSRETTSVGAITELGRVGGSGTGRITRYMMSSNRVGEPTVQGDEPAHYPQSVHDPVDVYLSSDGVVMVLDVREGTLESHEMVARPECVRMYSDATVRHALEQMCQGWSSYGFPALSYHWPDSFYFSDSRRPVISSLSSAQWVNITADAAPEQLMPVVFPREENSRTLNLLLYKGPKEMLVGFVRRGKGFCPALAPTLSGCGHLIVSTITGNGICLADYGEVINYDEDTPYPSEPHLMQFRFKGHYGRLLTATYKPGEVLDHLLRQLSFSQTRHEWKRDEQHR